MSAELISILVLVVVFVIATTRSINMGALAFAAAFGVGELVADLDADGIFAGFPGDLFVVLVGVTYLFAIARANGTTDWLVHASIRLVGGRIALIPWVMFVITGALTAIGAVSPAAVAIVAPIALSFAARYGISPLLMGAMVVHGAQGGGFSPISIYGSIVNGIVERENLPGNELFLFLASLVANLIIAAVVFVLFGGLKLTRHRADDSGTDGSTGDDRGKGTSPEAHEDSRLTPPRIATLIALVALLVAVLGFDLDAGLTAVTLAVVLSAFWPDTSRKAVSEIAWPTVLLICGVITYVGVLEEMGTITWRPRRGRRRHRCPAPRGRTALLRRCHRLGLRLLGRHHGRPHPAGRAVPRTGRDRCRRNDRRACRVGDGRGRQPVLDERRARARGRAGCRPRTVLPATDDLRRRHRRRGARGRLAGPGGTRVRVTRPAKPCPRPT